MRCRVVHVEEGWDMRSLHELREGARAKRLKPGTCIVAVNGKQDMARIIDCEGGVHTYYADKGTRFSLPLLSEMMKRGIGVELAIGHHDTQHVSAAAA